MFENSKPKLVAVTINWKDDIRTSKCVEALLLSEKVECVIVVDNESAGTMKGLAGVHPRCLIVEQPKNLGFAAGMNVGIENALRIGASHILCINNDAQIENTDIEKLFAALGNQNLYMVGPKILNTDGSLQSKGERISPRGRLSFRRTNFRDEIYLTWACVMLKAETFHRVGFLDTRFFMYQEDVDFCLRMLEMGLRYELVTGANCYHELNASHSKSKGLVEAYSMASLVAFGMKWRQRYSSNWFLLRAALRLIRVSLRPRTFALLVKAIKLGFRVETKAYIAVEENFFTGPD
jgi:GT2 family glycosyltransferase